MSGRMAGFSVGKRQRLLNKEDYIENGRINYSRLVNDLDKVAEKMAKEIRLLESI